MEIEYARTTRTEHAEGKCEHVFSDERLKELRVQGLTIPAIAEALGVSRGAIYQRVREHLETALHLSRTRRATCARPLGGLKGCGISCGISGRPRAPIAPDGRRPSPT